VDVDGGDLAFVVATGGFREDNVAQEYASAEIQFFNMAVILNREGQEVPAAGEVDEGESRQIQCESMELRTGGHRQA